MKIAVIRKLAEEATIEQLKAAEEALEQGQALPLAVEGNDEGEQLTHILAALWIKQDMDRNGTDLRTSLRSYSEKVRSSIN
jgi:hypothetical protein